MDAPRGRSELLVLLLAAAAVVSQCFLPPTVGLANNRDFAKIVGHFDVGNPFEDQDVFRFRDPQFKETFPRKISYARIAWFLIKHPRMALHLTISRLDDAGQQRPKWGNFDRLAGFPEYTQSWTFAAWSGLKARVFSRHGGRYLLYSLLLTVCVTAFAVLRRGDLPSGMVAAIVALAVMTLIELLVASFADALDPERQYSLFSVLTDLLWLSGLCLAAKTRSVKS